MPGEEEKPSSERQRKIVDDRKRISGRRRLFSPDSKSSSDKPYSPSISSLGRLFSTKPSTDPRPSTDSSPSSEKGSTVEAKYVKRKETYLAITPTEVEQLGQFNIGTIIFSTLSFNFLISFTEALRAVHFDDRITYQDVDLVGSFLLFVVPGAAAYFFHRSQSSLSKRILEQVLDDSKNS